MTTTPSAVENASVTPEQFDEIDAILDDLRTGTSRLIQRAQRRRWEPHPAAAPAALPAE